MTDFNHLACQAERDEQELETVRSGIAVIQYGGDASQDQSRALVRCYLEMHFRKWMQEYAPTHWKVLALETGRFILPDSLLELRYWHRPLLPVSPTMAIIGIELKGRLRSSGWLHERGINAFQGQRCAPLRAM